VGIFWKGFYLNDAPDFEAWIGNEREYWHRRMDSICNRLSQMQGERGEISDAIETTTRWVSHDPFNELAYRCLMQAHITAGDRTAALRTYDTCRAMLAKEFNARPAPETEALAERFPVSQEQAPSLLAVEPPLIGRENEHSKLVTLYHTLRAAGPQVVALLFAVRDALAHYKQAQRLARQPAGDPLHVASASATLAPSDLSHLFLQLGWAYELRSEFAQAKSVYEEMLTLAREMQESAMECAALNRLATLVARTSLDVARAEELLQQALTVAESSGNTAGVAETAWNLAQTGFYAGKISAPLPHAERALVLARELHLQELIGRSLHTLATLESALGRWEESLSHAEEARTRYVALGNREMEVGCLCKLAEVRINDGQSEEGINAARAALAISVEIEDPWGQINAAVQMVPGLLDCGAYTEALSVIQQGVALARALEITPLLVITLNEWGRVSRAMLALEAAHAAHSEALARCESFMPQQAFVERMAGELCADYALAGQWQEAYTYALKALAAREYSIMYGGLTRWHETEALLRGGSIEQAREDVHRFGERAHDKRRYRIPYLRALAVLAQWENEIDQAITHLEAARVLAEQLGLPGELWQILAVLGELYQSCKNESQAQQACARAAQVVQSLADGMEGEQQRTTFLSAQRVRAVLEHDATKRQGNDA